MEDAWGKKRLASVSDEIYGDLNRNQLKFTASTADIQDDSHDTDPPPPKMHK